MPLALDPNNTKQRAVILCPLCFFGSLFALSSSIGGKWARLRKTLGVAQYSLPLCEQPRNYAGVHGEKSSSTAKRKIPTGRVESSPSSRSRTYSPNTSSSSTRSRSPPPTPARLLPDPNSNLLSKPRPSTLRFPTPLALLSLPHITKVSWDGRADVLHLCYGLVLSDVRQVQLVDASSRVRNSTLGQPVSNILRGFLKPLRAEIERNPALNADIYALRGLEHAICRFQLLPNNREQTLRDPAVAAATHASCGSALQLVRLPPTLHIRRA
ncbi:hypothetical protein VTO73DRAFT_9840 [Trametes versicolor]